MLERILRRVCGHRRQVVVLFSIHLTIVLILLAFFPLIEPGTGSYVVAVIGLLLSSLTALSTLTLLFLCRQWDYDSWENGRPVE